MIKRKLLYELNTFDQQIIYSCTSYSEKLYQSEKECEYIKMLSAIVRSIDDKVIIITFDAFGNAEFERKVIAEIKNLPNVSSIRQEYSYNCKGLQFADNVCGVIRKHIVGNDKEDFYSIISNHVKQVKE